jgi:hypothetical protein
MNKTRPLIWAIQTLSKAIISFSDVDNEDDERQSIFEALDARKYIDEYLNKLHPPIQFTDDEAERSRNFHTYLRKNDDSHIGCIIYKLWSENRGSNAWSQFIRKMPELKVTTHIQYWFEDDVYTTDDHIMKHALIAWCWEINVGSFSGNIHNLLSYNTNNINYFIL